MSAKPESETTTPDGFSLRRWSRRKLGAARDAQATAQVSHVAAAPRPAADSTIAAAPATSVAPTPVELPPIESLTIESDFTVFFQPQVDETLKRAALKQLFRDPRFNVMDGLDIYVGDYTKSDPIPDHIIQQLVQARAIFNPPKTMVTAEGYVIDVPPEEVVLPADAKPAALGDAANALLASDASVLPSVTPSEQPIEPVAQSTPASDPDAAQSPQSAHPGAHTIAKS